MIDFETTGSVTAKKGLTKQDGYFDFCEGKQHRGKGRMQDGPFPAQQCSSKDKVTQLSCSRRIALLYQPHFKTSVCNVSVFSGIKFKESPAKDSRAGVPHSALCGSTQG